MKTQFTIFIHYFLHLIILGKLNYLFLYLRVKILNKNGAK